MSRTDESPLSPEDGHRKTAALNHLLGQIGLSNGDLTQWWNLVGDDLLEGRTPTQAWLAGDTEAVTTLVKRWYEASTGAAGRASGDPEFLALLRAKLATLDERVSGGGPLHRSA